MIMVEYDDVCDASCPGVDPATPPALNTWAMCEIHGQWWQSMDVSETPEEGPVLLWAQAWVPPYPVLVAAGLAPLSPAE